MQVVEEKGPINYENELEGDAYEEEDYDDDDMTYPGDPLRLSDPLHFSDYEDGRSIYSTYYIIILLPYKEILMMEMITEK